MDFIQNPYDPICLKTGEIVTLYPPWVNQSWLGNGLVDRITGVAVWKLKHIRKRRYHDNFSICPACQQPADLDHWNWQCPLQASDIHRCGGIPQDPLQRCLGWPIGHLNDDKIIQYMVTRREQAISWRLRNRRTSDPSDEGDRF